MRPDAEAKMLPPTTRSSLSPVNKRHVVIDVELDGGAVIVKQCPDDIEIEVNIV